MSLGNQFLITGLFIYAGMIINIAIRFYNDKRPYELKYLLPFNQLMTLALIMVMAVSLILVGAALTAVRL